MHIPRFSPRSTSTESSTLCKSPFVCTQQPKHPFATRRYLSFVLRFILSVLRSARRCVFRFMQSSNGRNFVCTRRSKCYLREKPSLAAESAFLLVVPPPQRQRRRRRRRRSRSRQHSRSRLEFLLSQSNSYFPRGFISSCDDNRSQQPTEEEGIEKRWKRMKHTAAEIKEQTREKSASL